MDRENIEKNTPRRDRPRKDDRRIIPQQVRKEQPNSNNIKKDNVVLSVVIPLLNEAESLPELALQLEKDLSKMFNGRYEVIMIDDGSTDNSFAMIQDIVRRNRKFKGIRFRRNYGKSAALSAGFERARGPIIITMDADLQDDPSEIQNLVAKLRDGYDMVSGWKKKRRDPITKTIPSKIWNFFTSIASGIKLHDFNCGLKAYKREVVKSLPVYGEIYRYLPAIAHWQGFKVGEIPVKHHARRYGKSKFGFTRFVKGLLDLMTLLFTTKYFKRPLHFFGTIGFLFALIGLGTDLYLTIEWFMGKTDLTNRPLALLGVALIIVGVQFISMGLLGELIVKNSLEKAAYSIRQQV